MTDQVLKEGEIHIGGVKYPLVGRVRNFLASRYPEKTIIGDTTRDSNPRISSVVFDDLRGGLGQDIMEGIDSDQAWESTWNTRHKRSIVLPPLVVATTESIGDGNPTGLGGVHNDLYGAWGDDIWTYDDVADVWTDTTRDGQAGGDPRSFEYMRVESLKIQLIPLGAGYLYRTSTTPTDAYTFDNQDVDFFAVWDNRFWGIDSNFNLFWFTVAGTHFADSTIRLNPDDGHDFGTLAPWGLALYPGPVIGGGTALHALIPTGLFVHDALNQTWHEIPLTTIAKFQNNQVADVFERGQALIWDGKHYITHGRGITEWDPANNTERLIDFTQEFGLSTSFTGGFHRLAASDRHLFVALVDTSVSKIFRWDGLGWDEIASVAGIIRNMVVITNSTSPTSVRLHRLYFSWGTTVSYIDLPKANDNPKFDTAYKYAAAAQLKTPWFHANQTDVIKLAKRIKVECLDMTANETITVSYALDYDDSSYTAFAAITASGVTTFLFPNATAPTGTAFKSIRFKVEGARGSTNTLSPRLVALTLEFRKKLEALDGARFNIRIPKGGHGGNTARQLLANIKTARDSDTQVECAWKDNEGGADNIWVDLTDYQAIEESGRSDQGDYLIEVQEA